MILVKTYQKKEDFFFLLLVCSSFFYLTLFWLLSIYRPLVSLLHYVYSNLYKSILLCLSFRVFLSLSFDTFINSTIYIFIFLSCLFYPLHLFSPSLLLLWHPLSFSHFLYLISILPLCHDTGMMMKPQVGIGHCRLEKKEWNGLYPSSSSSSSSLYL